MVNSLTPKCDARATTGSLLKKQRYRRIAFTASFPRRWINSGTHPQPLAEPQQDSAGALEAEVEASKRTGGALLYCFPRTFAVLRNWIVQDIGSCRTPIHNGKYGSHGNHEYELLYTNGSNNSSSFSSKSISKKVNWTYLVKVYPCYVVSPAILVPFMVSMHPPHRVKNKPPRTIEEPTMLSINFR